MTTQEFYDWANTEYSDFKQNNKYKVIEGFYRRRYGYIQYGKKIILIDKENGNTSMVLLKTIDDDISVALGIAWAILKGKEVPSYS